MATVELLDQYFVIHNLKCLDALKERKSLDIPFSKCIVLVTCSLSVVCSYSVCSSGH